MMIVAKFLFQEYSRRLFSQAHTQSYSTKWASGKKPIMIPEPIISLGRLSLSGSLGRMMHVIVSGVSVLYQR